MTASFSHHHFPPAVIRHAVRLSVRFTLSYRDVQDLLAERGLDVSYEAVGQPRLEESAHRKTTESVTTSGDSSVGFLVGDFDASLEGFPQRSREVIGANDCPNPIIFEHSILGRP